METWVQLCPNCRLAAPNIAEVPLKAKHIINHPDYQAIVRDESLPDLVRQFRAWSYLASKLGRHKKAAFASLHACWAADDEGRAELAQADRIKAARAFNDLKAKGLAKTQWAGAVELLIADLWRRVGQFDDAFKEAEIGALKAKTGDLQSLCRFQAWRSKANDSAIYTRAEALEQMKHA